MSADLLRRAVPNLRNPLLCNWDTSVARALADWLERTAEDFAELVKADAPDCPNCGEGCAGHPEANWCDRCCGAVDSQDYPENPCRCWTQALATARALVVSFGLDGSVCLVCRSPGVRPLFPARCEDPWHDEWERTHPRADRHISPAT